MYQQTEQRDAGRAAALTPAAAGTYKHTLLPLEHRVEPRPNFCTYALYFLRSFITLVRETHTDCSCEFVCLSSVRIKIKSALLSFPMSVSSLRLSQIQAVSVSTSESIFVTFHFHMTVFSKFLIKCLWCLSLR